MYNQPASINTNPEPTFGDRRVRRNFETTANREVEEFKAIQAEFIDKLNGLKASTPTGLTREECEIYARNIARAMTFAEDAATAAEKAVTTGL